jgi:tRNA threonylcarbamoyladenosine biosynthesis protein TsaB
MTEALWLAIDTATDIASVALGSGTAVLAQESTRGARRHAAEIVRLIDHVLKAGGCRAADLAGVVVADGPGSFTGLRIGWAAAKALVHAADVPLRTVPSLMAAAAAAAQGGGVGPVAACYDALRGQVYGAVYRFHADSVETLVAPVVATIDELAQRTAARPRAAVGDGAVCYADRVLAWTGARPVPLADLPPNAVQLLSLVTRAGAARPLADPTTAEPMYGRPAEAQAKWEARHGRTLPHPPGTSG